MKVTTKKDLVGGQKVKTANYEPLKTICHVQLRLKSQKFYNIKLIDTFSKVPVSNGPKKVERGIGALKMYISICAIRIQNDLHRVILFFCSFCRYHIPYFVRRMRVF